MKKREGQEEGIGWRRPESVTKPFLRGGPGWGGNRVKKWPSCPHPSQVRSSENRYAKLMSTSRTAATTNGWAPWERKEGIKLEDKGCLKILQNFEIFSGKVFHNFRVVF